jgi:hypothetical protein
MTTHTYDTITAAVNDLQRRGYTDQLTLSDRCVVCDGSKTELHPEDFQIDEFYRFEGDTDPADEGIVYAISSPKYGIKGVLVNGYGPSASSLTQEMVKKLATH